MTGGEKNSTKDYEAPAAERQQGPKNTNFIIYRFRFISIRIQLTYQMFCYELHHMNT